MRYFVKNGQIVATDELETQDPADYPGCIIRYCRAGEVRVDNGPALDPFPGWPDARKWRAIRRQRNRLLQESDWTQTEDAPLTATEKQEWKTYRRALRDLPQAFPKPDDVIFPPGARGRDE